jgi:hypothetical protein
MRLLYYGVEGELLLTDDLVDESALPAYAILSHTWVEGQDVTLQDLKAGTGQELEAGTGQELEAGTYQELKAGTYQDKPGYQKIEYCGRQAQRDGLQYFWVDTCCIDKSNNAEYQHAIKSMFRWYQNASMCYAYLADVSRKRKLDDGGDALELSWYESFSKSRWFTRGWTLQELIAPGVLWFYDSDWVELGNKVNLWARIREITAIPISALDGSPLFEFTTHERLQLGSNRQTTYVEDNVYSIVGFLGVDLAPIIGIGYEQAYRRLLDEIDKMDMCLRDMYVTNPRDDKKRIEDTKGGLLTDASRWVFETPEYQSWWKGSLDSLLWIRGDPGKGKTMLVCSIADKLQETKTRTSIMAYFFCQATDDRINSATVVLRGLLYMIIEQQPSLAYHIRRKYDRAGRQAFEGPNSITLLADTLSTVLEDPELRTTYLLIDALDECEKDLPKLLEFISRCSKPSSRIKWIVSSRNWPELDDMLADADGKVRLSLELNAASIAAAVDLFIEHKVTSLANRQQYDDQVKLEVLQYVTENAQETFLWVALVILSLENVPRRHVIAKLKSVPAGLDALYQRMLQRIEATDDAQMCKKILRIMATVFRPITIDELSIFVDYGDKGDNEELIEIVNLCGSFLTLQSDTLYFIHQSAEDFISTTASEIVISTGRPAIDLQIVTESLRAMSTLHRSLYNLSNLGSLRDNVITPIPDPLLKLRYSCMHWVEHLCQWLESCGAEEFLPQEDLVYNFLSHKLLYWLESAVLCGDLGNVVSSLVKFENLIQVFQVKKYYTIQC